MALDLEQMEIAKGLLGRGGSALLMATVARARDVRMGTRRWQVLAPDIVASVEQVLGVLENESIVEWVEMAVHQTLSGKPIASVPRWLQIAYRKSDALSILGRATDTSSLTCAIPHRAKYPSDRMKGLAAAAIALSRMQDTLDSFARMLPAEDGLMLVRMGRLAAVTVRAGEPTKMRAHVREILKEMVNGQDYQSG